MTDDLAVRPPLDKQRLLDALPTTAPGFTLEVVDEAPSTNALVAERARDGAPEGLVVVTEHQTAGRGRLDRTWETPDRAALTFSVLLRPTVVVAEWPWLPLLTGLAVASALTDAGAPVGLKWPNDVLLGDDKLAGILLERIETSTGAAAVLGIGLNVSTTAEELPVQTATSLTLATGRSFDRTGLLLGILGRLRQQYDAWQAAGSVVLRSAYAEACVTVGREVRVDLPSGGSFTGRASGVDDGGRLVVAGPDGEQAVGAGDVIHVRALDR
ncbi:MAG: biotin--[acetyl-CoA-carboxylase] ligase [Nocardioides sp.]